MVSLLSATPGLLNGVAPRATVSMNVDAFSGIALEHHKRSPPLLMSAWQWRRFSEISDKAGMEALAKN